MNIITDDELYALKNKIIIDVRTSGEYDEYHIEGAVNVPLFTDEQRAEIGTTYKKVSSDAAKRLGAKLITLRFSEIVDQIMDYSQEYDHVVMYCHRGGMRSKSITALLTALDLKNIYKLEGGIKKHRNYVMLNTQNALDKKKFIVLHGLTGVGKTKLLQKLESKEFDTIDYEGVANNAGSVFGNILYKEKQPNQRQFEESLFNLVKTSKSDYIFIESESKRVGSVHIPDEYLEKLDSSFHVLVTADIKTRTSILVDDYVCDDENKAVIKCINLLRKRLSNEKADYLVDLAEKNELDELVEILLLDYYDPLYNFSIDKYKPYDYTLVYDELNDTTDRLISILGQIERKENDNT